MIRRLLKRTNTITPLGRWSVDDNKSELRAQMANVDSCGDSLCGDPTMLKNNLDKISKRIIEYEEASKKKELAKQQNFFKSFR